MRDRIDDLPRGRGRRFSCRFSCRAWLGGGKDSGGAAGGERDCRAALECVWRAGRADAGSGFFHAHGHCAAVHPVQRRRGIHVRARGFGREGNYCGAGCRGGGAARGGVSDWFVVCVGRRARFGGRKGGEPGAKGKPIPDQRRADGQSRGAGVKRGAARGVSRHGQDGALGVSRAGRERGAQAGAGDGEAAGTGAAGDAKTLGRAR